MISKFIIKISVLLLFLGMNMASYSQEFPSREYGVPGKLVNSPYFKHFAVLMQDSSTDHGNRFRYRNEFKVEDLPFLYIDSATFYECERRLLHPDSLITFYYRDDSFLNFINKKIFHRCLKKYIRLYAGFIDENNDKVVCVQFVTLKEFNENGFVYKYSQSKYTFNPKLRVAYIRFEK